MRFNDPRNPTGERNPLPTRFATSREELTGLLELCRAGRIYDVETWIADGRPLQISGTGPRRHGRRQATALEVAMERGDHSLVHLLLANGYDPNQEESSPLDQALRDRRWDLVDLLLDWGANPADVDPDAVFGTYRTPLFERFRNLGVDFCAGHALAEALSSHTSNKPLFGFARRYRSEDLSYQKGLNIALVHYASKGNEKGVMLCLWAGADPHAEAPDLTYSVRSDGDHDDEEEQEEREFGVSAVWQACCSGHNEILARLRPDPQRDDFDSLYRVARNSAIMKVLIAIEPPLRPGAVVCSLIQAVAWRASLQRWGSLAYGSYESIHALEALFDAGVRWEVADRAEASSVRAVMIKLEEYDFVRIVKLLATQNHCSGEVLREIGRTAAFRKRLRETGFIPPEANDRCQKTYNPPTRAREVLKAFGIELPKPAAAEQYLPKTVWIGRPRPGTNQLAMSRQQLFERIWSTPVETLAAEWGLSGRGLSKACARLHVPVPPRGYWARVASGQHPKKPRLAALAHGHAEEVVVWQAPDPRPEPR